MLLVNVWICLMVLKVLRMRFQTLEGVLTSSALFSNITNLETKFPATIHKLMCILPWPKKKTATTRIMHKIENNSLELTRIFKESICFKDQR